MGNKCIKCKIAYDTLYFQVAEEQPFKSLEEIGVAAAAGGDRQEQIPKHTVRRRLRDDGIRSRVAAAKIDTSARHRELRVAYAERMMDQQEEYWMGIKFSDEKTFSSDTGLHVLVRS